MFGLRLPEIRLITEVSFDPQIRLDFLPGTPRSSIVVAATCFKTSHLLRPYLNGESVFKELPLNHSTNVTAWPCACGSCLTVSTVQGSNLVMYLGS